jgi:Bacterial regulatory proteins, tetR family
LHELLLEAASELFYEHGVAATNVEDVAARPMSFVVHRSPYSAGEQ